MNIKFITSVGLVIGVLMFLEIKPSDALEKVGNTWEEFSADFMAIFDGKAKDNIAREARTQVDMGMQAACEAADSTASNDEYSDIARGIYRTRCEAAKNDTTIILDPEELAQRLKDRQNQLQ